MNEYEDQLEALGEHSHILPFTRFQVELCKAWYAIGRRDIHEEITRLQNALKVAREGLEFYSEPNCSYVNGLTTYTRYKSDSDRHEDCGDNLIVVGKTAREKLKEIDEIIRDKEDV